LKRFEESPLKGEFFCFIFFWWFLLLNQLKMEALLVLRFWVVEYFVFSWWVFLLCVFWTSLFYHRTFVLFFVFCFCCCCF
jgi:hypothetical protein